jgi:phytoene dehydrogenase-like protein
VGVLADTLAESIASSGGSVLRKRRAAALEERGGRATAVLDARGQRHPAEVVVSNLTPEATGALLGEPAAEPRGFAWGAFTLYAALRADAIPPGLPTHHQVVLDPSAPLGEGNSAFLSLSPEWDTTRGRPGERVATLSTHTRPAAWLGLDKHAYAEAKARATERLLRAAERAIPGFGAAATLVFGGTPRSFQRFTGRPLGLVGGYPQRGLLSGRSPGTRLHNLLLVGDSIFPGQSTAAVTLGALRVARLAEERATRGSAAAPLAWSPGG